MVCENVAVIARFRPPTAAESEERGCSTCARFEGTDAVSLELHDKESPLQHTFRFSQVFQPDDDQRAIYEQSAAPLVDGLLEGLNAAVIAYGQTGSGKTHTMMGGDDAESAGIMPRLVTDVFREVHVRTLAGENISVTCSYIELYMERVRDLLRPVLGSTAGGHVSRDSWGDTMMGSEDNLGITGGAGGAGLHVADATQVPVHSTGEVLAILRQGGRARATAATNSNATSSRSHALLVLTLTNRSGAGTKTSQLYCVDLAGSERQKKTGADAVRLDEANTINTSLLALGNVINSLAEQHKEEKRLKKLRKKGKKGKKKALLPVSYIPYRDSKLTRILQNALGGNSRTMVVCCCSPAPSSARETLSTLRFGDRASTIRNTPKAVVKRSVEELEALLAKAEANATEWRTRATVAEMEVSTLRRRPARPSTAGPALGAFAEDEPEVEDLEGSSSEEGEEQSGGVVVVGSGVRAPMAPRFGSLDIGPTLCPLSGDVMIDPCLAGDGMSYERTAIELYWRRHGQVSPMTGARLPGRVLIPQKGLRALIASIYPPEALGSRPDWLSFLPLEVVKRILGLLGDNIETLCCAAQVCREWNEIVGSAPAWQTRLLQDFGAEGPSEDGAPSPAQARALYRKRVEQRHRPKIAPAPARGLVLAAAS